MWGDTGISTWILENVSIYPGLNEFLKILLLINSFGLLWLIPMGIFIYLDFKKYKRIDFSYLLFLLTTIIGVGLIAFVLQPIFARPHPYETIEGFAKLNEDLNINITKYSLPSISAYTSIAYSFFLTIKKKDYSTYYFIAAFIMCISELILGVSYLSDIIFGRGLGALFGGLGNLFQDKMIKFLTSVGVLK